MSKPRVARCDDPQPPPPNALNVLLSASGASGFGDGGMLVAASGAGGTDTCARVAAPSSVVAKPLHAAVMSARAASERDIDEAYRGRHALTCLRGAKAVQSVAMQRRRGRNGVYRKLVPNSMAAATPTNVAPAQSLVSDDAVRRREGFWQEVATHKHAAAPPPSSSFASSACFFHRDGREYQDAIAFGLLCVAARRPTVRGFFGIALLLVTTLGCEKRSNACPDGYVCTPIGASDAAGADGGTAIASLLQIPPTSLASDGTSLYSRLLTDLIIRRARTLARASLPGACKPRARRSARSLMPR